MPDYDLDLQFVINRKDSTEAYIDRKKLLEYNQEIYLV